MGSINLLVTLESRTLKNFLPTLNALNNYLPQPLLQSPPTILAPIFSSPGAKIVL